MDDVRRRMMQKFIADYRKSQQHVPAKIPATADDRSAARIAIQGNLPFSYADEHNIPWGGPGEPRAHADSVRIGLKPTITEGRLGGKPSIADSTAKYGILKSDPSLSVGDRLKAGQQFDRFRGLQKEIDPSTALLDEKAKAEQDVLYGTPAEKKLGRKILTEIGKNKGLMAAPKTITPEKKPTLIQARGKYSDALTKLNKLQKTPIMTPELMESLMESPLTAMIFTERGILTSDQADSDTMKELVAALQNEVDHWKNYIDEEEYNEKITVDETTGKIKMKDF